MVESQANYIPTEQQWAEWNKAYETLRQMSVLLKCSPLDVADHVHAMVEMRDQLTTEKQALLAQLGRTE